MVEARDEAEPGLRLVGALWRFWRFAASSRKTRTRRTAAGHDNGEVDSPCDNGRLRAPGGSRSSRATSASTRLVERSFALQAEVGDAAETALLSSTSGCWRTPRGAATMRGRCFSAEPRRSGDSRRSGGGERARVSGSSSRMPASCARCVAVFDRSLVLAARPARNALRFLADATRGDGARRRRRRPCGAALRAGAHVQRELGDTWSIASSSTNLAALMLNEATATSGGAA